MAATGTAGIGIQAVALSGQNGYSTALIRGDLLGSAVGTADAASVSVTNALTYASIGGQANGALGLTSLSIRSDIIADTSSTGLGSGFLTQDLATGLLRPLNQTTELLSSTAGLTLATKAQNVGLSSASARQSIGGSVQLNSLTLLAGGNLTGVAGTPSTAVVTVNSSGILALASSAISVPQIQSQGITMYIHVVGAGTALTLNGSISNTTQGLVKAGDGSLVFAAPQYFTGVNGTNGLVINGGTVQLAGGRNTVLAYTSGTGAVLQTLVANAGTLDLNGNSQAFERLQSANILPGGGGVITNTAGTAATLTLASTASTTFGGAINGNLNLLRIGTGTQTFSNALGFTGVANIGGAVTLTDQATLSAASAINLNGSTGTLILDNRGMFGNAARIGTVPVTLNGGKLCFQSTIVQNDAQSVGSVTVGAGAGTLDVTLYNTTASAGSATLTVASLAQNAGGTLNFSSSGAGALGAPLSSDISTGYVQGGFVASPTSSPRIVITSAPTVTNGIIGGWATVGGTDWATYLAPGSNAGYGGVIALGTGSIPGFMYSTAALSAGVATDNINQTGTTALFGITSRTINSFRNAGAASFNLAGLDQTLTIATGGFLSTVDAQGHRGGRLTAGITAGASLYLNQGPTGTVAIQFNLVDNAAGTVNLVKAGAGTVVIGVSPIGYSQSTTTAANTMTVTSTANYAVGLGFNNAVNGIAVGNIITGITSGTVLTLDANVGTGAATPNSAYALLPTYKQVLNSSYISLGSAPVSGTIFALTVPAGTVVYPGMPVTTAAGSTGALAGTVVSVSGTTVNILPSAAGTAGATRLIFAPVVAATASASNLTTGSSTVTIPANVTGLNVGQGVSGTGIAAGTYVTAYNAATGVVTLSAPVTTVAATSALTFAAPTIQSVIGNVTNASATVTVASNANMFVGQPVTGAGIPQGTTVAAISGTTGVTLSNNATASTTGNLFFGLAPLGLNTPAAATATAVTTLVLQNAAGVVVGQSVTGAGIPVGATVTAVSGNNVTLSAATNAAITAGTSIAFGAPLGTMYSNTYSGTTYVNAGTLQLGNSGTGTGGILGARCYRVTWS